MESEQLFKFGGFLFIISGVLSLFYWLVSIMDGFENSLVPGISSFSAQTTFMGLLQNILLVIGILTLSIAIILAGLVFVRMPGFIETHDRENMEKKLNRVQNIIWKVLQHMKK